MQKKKVATKKKPVIETPVIETPKFKYHLEMIFNNETFHTDTNDIAESILSFKPRQLLTEMFINITRDGATSQRRLNRMRGRRIFSNPESLEIFLMSVFVI